MSPNPHPNAHFQQGGRGPNPPRPSFPTPFDHNGEQQFETGEPGHVVVHEDEGVPPGGEPPEHFHPVVAHHRLGNGGLGRRGGIGISAANKGSETYLVNSSDTRGF